MSVLEKHTETETAALLNILIDEVRKAQGSVKKIVINDEYRCWVIGAGTYIIFGDKNRKSIGFAVFCEESQRWQNVWFFRGI